MNQVVAVLLIAAGTCAHFTFCEWEVSNEARDYATSGQGRTIFYRQGGQSSITSRRGYVALLARSGVDLNEAKLYGVVLAGLMLGGGLLVFQIRFGSKSGT